MKKLLLGCGLYFILGGCTTHRTAMVPAPAEPEMVMLAGQSQGLPMHKASLLPPMRQNKADSFRYYEEALAELHDMLSGAAPLHFKEAVFTVENAYFDNRMRYELFDSAIHRYAAVCRAIESYSSLKNYHHWRDSGQIVKNQAIYAFMMKPIAYSEKYPLLLRSAYCYDFEDCFGEKDWTKTFITKLMATNSGTCHSLPFLYKILAEELGTDASLALAPNHIYIKQKCEKYNGYNTELTNAQFPIDGWIMAAGYIPLETIQKGVYMKKLSDRQAIAVCLYDLAEGYRHRFKNDTAAFIIKCLDLALQENPKYIDALQFKGRTYKAVLDYAKARANAKSIRVMLNDTALRSVYMKMQDAYATIAKLGHREMPERMYREWLSSMEYEKEKYTGIHPVVNNSGSVGAYYGTYDKEAEAYRPFKHLHVKTARVVSLSGGRYDEFIDYDSLVSMDNITVSRNTHTITKIADKPLRPAGSSRWMSPDPLAQKYPSVSPYMALGNNPIFLVDPDGQDIIPTPQLQRSKWGLVITVMQSQMVSNTIINKYFGQFTGANSNHNWLLSYESGHNAVGHTEPRKDPAATEFDPGYTVYLQSMVTVGNNAYKVFNAQIYSDLGMASTVLHEGIHTFLINQNPKMTADEQHELMATGSYRDDLISGIMQFARDNKIKINRQDAEDLAWGGLEDTKAFKAHFGEEGKRTEAQAKEYQRWVNNTEKLNYTNDYVNKSSDLTDPETSKGHPKGEYDLPQR